MVPSINGICPPPQWETIDGSSTGYKTVGRKKQNIPLWIFCPGVRGTICSVRDLSGVRSMGQTPSSCTICSSYRLLLVQFSPSFTPTTNNNRTSQCIQHVILKKKCTDLKMISHESKWGSTLMLLIQSHLIDCFLQIILLMNKNEYRCL